MPPYPLGSEIDDFGIVPGVAKTLTVGSL